MRHPRIVAVMLAMVALGGCAVGMVSVSTPERAPPSAVPPLAQRLTFDVCAPPGAPAPTAERRATDRRGLGSQVAEALARAGVSADLADAPGAPVRFILTELPTESRYQWSVLLSFFTLSVIPGYSVDRMPLEVSLAWRDPAGAERHERLRYEYSMSTFVWVPLIVHPDLFAGLNGGKDDSPKIRQAGFERTLARLADDLRARLATEGAGAAPEVAGVTCPGELAEPGRAGSPR